MLKVLIAFHHQAAQRITGTTAKRGVGGDCKYPSVEEAMNTVGTHPIGVYIKSWKANIP